MKKSLFLYLLLANLLIVMGACQKENISDPDQQTESADRFYKNHGPSANGQGQFEFLGFQRLFVFHANTMPNGSVKGNGVLKYLDGELDSRFSIDCISVEGNVATMSGTIIEHSDPNRVGWDIWFKVIDNGEGANSETDQMTPQGFGPTLFDCSFPYVLDLYEITTGNIQVRN